MLLLLLRNLVGLCLFLVLGTELVEQMCDAVGWVILIGFSLVLGAKLVEQACDAVCWILLPTNGNPVNKFQF